LPPQPACVQGSYTSCAGGTCRTLGQEHCRSDGEAFACRCPEAIAAKAEADGIGGEGHPRRKKLNFADLNAILERAAARPVLDARTPDEILGDNA
jgi:hypothetical protein